MSDHDNQCELMGDHDATDCVCCCSERREIERLRAEVVDVTRRLGQTRLRLVRAIEQIRSMPGADNETAYEMRKLARETLGHE